MANQNTLLDETDISPDCLTFEKQGGRQAFIAIVNTHEQHNNNCQEAPQFTPPTFSIAFDHNIDCTDAKSLIGYMEKLH